MLLPHKLSQLGPALATADVDNNGLTDCYIGGAHKQSGELWLQTSAGIFTKSSSNTWRKDKDKEDIDALFFDADTDGDLDLYVVSGSNEFEENSSLLQDRLYLNNGKGQFQKTTKALPQMPTSGGCVAATDFDEDGDQDLFVGGRVVPGNYPVPASSYLLENKNGIFKDVTTQKGKDLQNPGLITDAIWSDFNGDGKIDLIVVGEWTDILFYEHKDGPISKIPKTNLA